MIWTRKYCKLYLRQCYVQKLMSSVPGLCVTLFSHSPSGSVKLKKFPQNPLSLDILEKLEDAARLVSCLVWGVADQLSRFQGITEAQHCHHHVRHRAHRTSRNRSFVSDQMAASCSRFDFRRTVGGDLTITLDEAHYIMNPNTQLADAWRRLRGKFRWRLLDGPATPLADIQPVVSARKEKGKPRARNRP